MIEYVKFGLLIVSVLVFVAGVVVFLFDLAEGNLGSKLMLVGILLSVGSVTWYTWDGINNAIESAKKLHEALSSDDAKAALSSAVSSLTAVNRTDNLLV